MSSPAKFCNKILMDMQIINVYNQEYESAAAFWPDVHSRIIVALVVSQLLLMGLLSTKQASQSTPLLIALPVLTIWFHVYCKGRYGPAFVKFPLQVGLMFQLASLLLLLSVRLIAERYLQVLVFHHLCLNLFFFIVSLIII